MDSNCKDFYWACCFNTDIFCQWHCWIRNSNGLFCNWTVWNPWKQARNEKRENTRTSTPPKTFSANETSKLVLGQVRNFRDPIKDEYKFLCSGLRSESESPIERQIFLPVRSGTADPGAAAPVTIAHSSVHSLAGTVCAQRTVEFYKTSRRCLRNRVH